MKKEGAVKAKMNPTENEAEAKEMQHSAEKIWNAISRYITNHVTIEKDAIFKDPDWPHLWDHKR